MLTSILLPVYNGENYIESSIVSILEQEGDWELIIQDDCSTDKTAEICERYISSRVFYYRNDNNKKCWGTLNEAVKQAKGELFRLFSHDDIMLKGDILNCEQYMKRNPDVVLSFSNYDMIDSIGKLTGGSIDYLERNSQIGEKMAHDTALINLFNWGCISGTQSNITIRRELYAKIDGFNSLMFYAGDFDLLARASMAGVIAYNPAKTCQIRFHSMQTSKEGGKAITKLNEIKHITSYLIDNIQDKEVKIGLKRKFGKIYGYQLLLQQLKFLGQGKFKPTIHFVRTFGLSDTVDSFIYLIKHGIKRINTTHP